MKPIIVVWKDAASVDEWQDIDEARKDTVHTVQSVGHLFHETDESITIALSHNQTADHVSQSLVIPKAWIQSQQLLRPVRARKKSNKA